MYRLKWLILLLSIPFKTVHLASLLMVKLGNQVPEMPLAMQLQVGEARFQSITEAVRMCKFHQPNAVPESAFWGRAQHLKDGALL